MLGLAQTVLAALHTWLRPAELSERHRQAGGRYACVRRRIEQVQELVAVFARHVSPLIFWKRYEKINSS